MINPIDMRKKKREEVEAVEWGSCPELKNTLLFQMHRIHSVMFRVANNLIHEALRAGQDRAVASTDDRLRFRQDMRSRK